MTVPSHNLYDFVHQVTENHFWLMYFHPWGQKDFLNLKDYYNSKESIFDARGLKKIYAQDFLPDELLDVWAIRNFQPILLCHDQEPLYYEYYQDHGPGMAEFNQHKRSGHGYPLSDQNLRSCHPWSWHQHWILLHSEKNSAELQRYESTGRYRGAYWWSHAMLSLDWYRFAQHDKSLNDHRDNSKLFLIYARDFEGTRAYRKKLLELTQDLQSHLQIGSVHGQAVPPESSAIYDSTDFINTDISVVLETLFCDDRIHLTEKTLRPIACGQPFILAAGAGSLELLKEYGFETYSPWINESYDQETDHDRRLEMISEEMHRIAGLSLKDKTAMISACRLIAQKNKNHFFSDQFKEHIINELKHNVSTAWTATKDHYDPSYWWNTRRWRRQHRPEHFYQPKEKAQRSYLVPFVRHLRQNQGLFKKYQGHEHSLDDKSNTNGDDI